MTTCAPQMLELTPHIILHQNSSLKENIFTYADFKPSFATDRPNPEDALAQLESIDISRILQKFTGTTSTLCPPSPVIVELTSGT